MRDECDEKCCGAKDRLNAFAREVEALAGRMGIRNVLMVCCEPTHDDHLPTVTCGVQQSLGILMQMAEEAQEAASDQLAGAIIGGASFPAPNSPIGGRGEPSQN